MKTVYGLILCILLMLVPIALSPAQPVVAHDAAVFPIVWIFPNDEGSLYPDIGLAVRQDDIAAITIGHTANPLPHVCIAASVDGHTRFIVAENDWEFWVNEWATRIGATVVDMRPGSTPTVVFGVYQIWILPLNETGTEILAIRPDKIISIKEYREDPENRVNIRIDNYYSNNWVVWGSFDTYISGWSNEQVVDWR